MHNISGHIGPKLTMSGLKQTRNAPSRPSRPSSSTAEDVHPGYWTSKVRQAFLPIPKHLESKLPPLPPLCTAEESEAVRKEHARLSQNPSYNGYPQFTPSTKEQWERYHRRREIMRKRRELAMTLDSDYRRLVEEGRAELRRQRALEREADINEGTD